MELGTWSLEPGILGFAFGGLPGACLVLAPSKYEVKAGTRLRVRRRFSPKFVGNMNTYDTAFLDDLASAAPVPGGGGASAYMGALACALASMVGNLTVGKKAYADVENDVRVSLERLEALRARLVGLIDEDARAFEPLAAAYRLPKATPEETAAKNAALQQALVGACEVPLAIMRTVAEALDEVDYLAKHGSKMARSDAGVAAACARAASDGASLNVYINCASMDNADQAAGYREEVDALAVRTRERCDELFAFVKAAVS